MAAAKWRSAGILLWPVAWLIVAFAAKTATATRPPPPAAAASRGAAKWGEAAAAAVVSCATLANGSRLQQDQLVAQSGYL